jgi:hypothetical protein
MGNQERLCAVARLLHLLHDLQEVGPHDAAELGEMRVVALAVHQGSAELILQVLNGPR